MSTYHEKFQELSDRKLLLILENAEEYESEAVLAATEVLNARGISDSDRSFHISEIRGENQKHTVISEAGEIVKEKVGKPFWEYIKVFDPFNPGQQFYPRLIDIISVFAAISFIYSFFNSYESYRGAILDFPRFPGAALFLISYLVVYPLANYHFYKRKPLGWALVMIILLLTILTSFTLMVMPLFQWAFGGEVYFDYYYMNSPFLFAICITFVMLRKGMREQFEISTKQASIVVASGICICSVILYLLRN